MNATEIFAARHAAAILAQHIVIKKQNRNPPKRRPPVTCRNLRAHRGAIALCPLPRKITRRKHLVASHLRPTKTLQQLPVVSLATSPFSRLREIFVDSCISKCSAYRRERACIGAKRNASAATRRAVGGRQTMVHFLRPRSLCDPRVECHPTGGLLTTVAAAGNYHWRKHGFKPAAEMQNLSPIIRNGCKQHWKSPTAATCNSSWENLSLPECAVPKASAGCPIWEKGIF